MNASLQRQLGLSKIARRALVRAGLEDITDKVVAGERLSLEEGMRLFETPDAAAVGSLANLVRERLHGDRTYYNRNQHINATNVCEATCMFCSFSRLKTGDPRAYTMSMEQALSRIRRLRDTFITEVHIVNGLNPDLPFSYYTDLLKALKEERPDLHIKGFTAVEIHYFHEKYGMTYPEVIQALRDAGLDSMPGGGAEIFAHRVRKKICHDKVDGPGWLEIHRVAHGMGMRTNCTMLFGMIETLEERLDHMIQLRELQDETGGFQTFIPLKFHNEHNRLNGLYEATGIEVLRTFAVARLMLDNIPHLKAYWPMLGVQVAQTSLGWGVDDLDGTVREERIYHMAGAKTPQALGRADLVAMIEDARRVPIERDTLYHVAAEA